jgi:hypothetical protein
MSSTFIGKPWNTDMPTIGHGIRVCPNCGEEVWVDRIMAYEDAELWTCPRGTCKARVSQKPENGRFGTKVVPDRAVKPDRTRETDDFKRNDQRRYRGKNWRRENKMSD